ncbi:response regulator [Aliiglaciecola sp. 3_MG-2023]|uniref:ATP-binding protein n=1 Tax=Aliiglaciecola sp. 3_MG-2023 TaxID=3062644 RepID=UPI0026E2C9FE|nr:ATP-binding protein [Aliiglaciecola sp. 3_MG-2023]MDO6695717.1 response regulator [Aliiglaciecola sp. 3_MG-2023]
MKSYKYLVQVIVFFSISTSAHSFDTFYELEGKSLGLVYSVLQGKNSIWLGSENGLFKLTGLHVESKSTNEEPFNGYDIEGLAEDQNGKLWVALFGNGVVIYDQNLREYRHVTTDRGLVSNHCLDVKVNQNFAYVRCEKSVSIININTLEVSNVTSTQQTTFGFVEDIQVSNSGELFFLDSENHLFSFNGSILRKLDLIDSNSKQIKLDCFHIDSEGTLWYAVNNKIFKKNNSGTAKVLETDKKISRIFTYKENALLYFSDSFYYIDLELEKLILPLRILNNSKLTIEEIYDFDITATGGVIFSAPLIGVGIFNDLSRAVDRLLPKNFENVNLQASAQISDNQIALAFQDNIYILYRVEREIKKVASFYGAITALTYDENSSKILVGVEDKGVFEVNYSKEKSIADTNVLPLYETEGIIVDITSNLKDTLHFGVLGSEHSGIYEIDKTGLITLILEKDNVDNLYQKSDGKLITVTRDKGVFDLLFPKKISKVDRKAYINNCLIEDNKGVIWLCTDGAGLAYVDEKSDEIVYIDTVYTANSRHIRELVQDSEGYFWVMTNQGLVRYDHVNRTSIKLGREDGIQDVDFEITASINLEGEQILVAGDRENYIVNTRLANQFLNKRLRKVSQALFVDLMVLIRDKQGLVSRKRDLFESIANDLPIEISYEEFLFELSFAANNFVDRNIIQFQYRLVGLNDNWIDASSETAKATYSTLPSGDYVFEVRVVDPKSASIQPVNSLKIKVRPPFWQTWQAYIVYLCACILAFISFNKYRTIQLKSLNERLESSVLVQTKELATSKRRLKDLLHHKELLYANASHEFRTPLSLIRGPIEQLANIISDEKSKQFLEILKINVFRLTNLVDQVLELSKVDSSKLDDKVHYDLHNSVEIIVESFRPISLSKKQQLILDNNCKGTGTYIADSLEKILSNLLMNAFKYNKKDGSVKVFAATNGGVFKIEISDQGFGIAAENIDLIFQRFTRLENVSESNGSGLGLAVVKELVTANGGSIDVESQIDVGTKFTVSLPVNYDISNSEPELFVSVPIGREKTELDLDNADAIESNTIEDAAKRPSILIVEDQSEMRNYLSLIFSEEYNCYKAENGQEGFRKSLEILPDIIITDLMMPSSDGFELSRSVRDNELTSHIPIVMLTAKGDDKTRIESWGYHIDDYIKKPFNNTELLARVKNLLAIRRKISQKYNFNAVENKDVFELNSDCLSSERDTRFYDKFICWLEDNYKDNTCNRGRAVVDLAISERQLTRKLTAFTNSSFTELLRRYRLLKARSDLLNGKQITETAFNVGFSSPAYFSNQFKKEFGLSPKAFMKKMKVD